jgi:hypothetical protein
LCPLGLSITLEVPNCCGYFPVSAHSHRHLLKLVWIKYQIEFRFDRFIAIHCDGTWPISIAAASSPIIENGKNIGRSCQDDDSIPLKSG